MLKIRSRTPVLCADSDRVVFFVHKERIAKLIADGTLKQHDNYLRISGGCVSDVRPGSFGIRRQHVPVGREYGLSGGVVFSHHNLHERTR